MTSLETQQLSLIAGQRQLIADLNWAVKQGEFWCVLGKNGAGKSSLLHALAGLSNTNVPGPGTFVKPINPDSGPVLTIPIDVSLPPQATPAGETILRFTGQAVATRGGFILQPVLLWVPSATVPGQFTLVWDARFKLQSTAALGTPNWTDYPARAPVDVSCDGEAGFFRLVPAP